MIFTVRIHQLQVCPLLQYLNIALSNWHFGGYKNISCNTEK